MLGKKTLLHLFTFGVTLILTPVINSSDLVFDHFEVEDGLSQSSVLDIIQDDKGFLWITTEDGLNRFDGYRFHTFRHDPLDSTSIPGNYMRDFFRDSDHSLWIRTNDGVLAQYLGNDKFHTYKHDPNNIHSISTNKGCHIFKDSKKNIWLNFFTNKYGLNRFDKVTETFWRYEHNPSDSTSISHNNVSSIIKDGQGHLWMGTEHGLNKFDSETETFQRYYIKLNDSPSVKAAKNRNHITTLVEDQLGRLWIGTKAGLFIFDDNTGQFHYPPKIRTIIPDFDQTPFIPLLCDSYNDCWIQVHDRKLLRIAQDDECNLYSLVSKKNHSGSFRSLKIFEDRHKNIWVVPSDENGGLHLFDRINNKFIIYQNDPNIPSSLSDNQVRMIYEDNQGTLWVGTSGGLNKLDRFKNRFKIMQRHPGKKSGLNCNQIRAIYKDSQNILWIGTRGGGLNSYDPETRTFKHYFRNEKNDKIIADNIETIYQDKEGVFWFGTYNNGLIRYDQIKNTVICYPPHPENPDSLRHGTVSCIYEDKKGDFLVGTRDGGLNLFDKKQGKFSRYKMSLHDTNFHTQDRILDILEDRQGFLWIAAEGGLRRYDRKNNTVKNYRHDPDNPQSLSNSIVFSLYEDSQGILWIGTFHGGLNRFDKKTKTFKSYRIKDGLPNDIVYGILEDKNGYLWLSTNNGLSRFDPKTEVFKNFTVKDGLPTNACNALAYFKSPAGDMYFGTEKGLVYFKPEAIIDNDFIPPVQITNFKKFNKTVKFDKEISELAEITISYEDYVFSFEFVALSFINPQKNQYAYMLEGLHDDWIYCGTQRIATFSKIPPGTYHFRVKASNNDGIWNEQGASVNIVITPPYWQTWWFRLALFLIFLSAMYSIYRIRIAQLKRIETIRIQIANDLHDEIGSNLGSISLMSSALKSNNIPKELKNNYLGTICDITKRTADSMRDIIWFINPDNDNAEKIILRMQDFISKMLYNIDYKFDPEENTLTDKFDLNVKRNIFLIFKESINNIVRHAKASAVEIRIEKEDGKFQMRIKDNGTGFHLDASNTGTGINSMQKRAAEIKANLQMNSVPKEGTEILLVMDV